MVRPGNNTYVCLDSYKSKFLTEVQEKFSGNCHWYKHNPEAQEEAKRYKVQILSKTKTFRTDFQFYRMKCPRTSREVQNRI